MTYTRDLLTPLLEPPTPAAPEPQPEQVKEEPVKVQKVSDSQLNSHD